MNNTPTYLKPLQAIFEMEANTKIAHDQSAYMRNQFVYYGLKTPQRRNLIKTFIKEHSLPSYDEMEGLILWMWKQPQREWQYTAIELAVKIKKQWDDDFLKVIEFAITNKSWWDTVDAISSEWAGNFFMAYPSLIIPSTKRWNQSDNIWLQRASIIFQLQYKLQTNEEILFGHSANLITSKEFFIQKGMGWALRQYARVNPEAVRKFVAENAVSNLTKREAMKHL